MNGTDLATSKCQKGQRPHQTVAILCSNVSEKAVTSGRCTTTKEAKLHKMLDSSWPASGCWEDNIPFGSLW